MSIAGELKMGEVVKELQPRCSRSVAYESQLSFDTPVAFSAIHGREFSPDVGLRQHVLEVVVD